MEDSTKRTQEELQELNRQRSTGSIKDPGSPAPTDHLEELLQHAKDPQIPSFPYPKLFNQILQAIGEEQGAVGIGNGYTIFRDQAGELASIFLKQGKYDAELDPSKPEFNHKKWKALYDAAQLPESVQEDFTQSLSQIIGAAIQGYSQEEYKAAIAGSMKRIAAASDLANNAIAALATIDASFPKAEDLLKGEPPANAALLSNLAVSTANGFSSALAAAIDAAETMKLILHPDFAMRLQNTILGLTSALNEDELNEVRTQFKAAEEENANQLSLFEEAEKPADPKDPSHRKIAAAIEEGALVSFSSAAFATTGNLLKALTRDSIFMLPNETDLKEFDEHGQINKLIFSKRPPQQIETAQTGLFGAMLYAVLNSYSPEAQENNTINVYVPKLLEALHIEARPYKRAKHGNLAELRYQKMLELLQPFDRWIGRFPDGSFFRFLTIESYSENTETMRIISPYLFELVRRNDERRYTFLAHADIANERNQAAVEIAMRLLQGLAKRGTSVPDAKTYKSKAKPKKRTIRTVTPDGNKTTIIEEYQEDPQEQPDPGRPAVFTYEYSYKNLIHECPQIRYELEKILGRTGNQAKTAKQAYNAKLKQTFAAAFRILMEKTDAPLYYKNLHFTNTYPNGEFILPTKSTLSAYVGLEHNGRNKEYTQRENS